MLSRKEKKNNNNVGWLYLFVPEDIHEAEVCAVSASLSLPLPLSLSLVPCPGFYS